MASAAKLKTMDFDLLNDIFEMWQGYVMNFSDRTFSDFFDDELGINIDDPKYSLAGGSKAKRLRYFLRESEPQLVARTLLALGEYRASYRRRSSEPDPFPTAQQDIASLIAKLGGSRTAQTVASAQVVSAEVASALSQELVALSKQLPHARGFAFEKFLKSAFEAHGLSPRGSFRLTGEQIDGSFVINGEVYLLEAKWTNDQTDAATLRSFNAKVEDKARWTRGLFISNSGFTEQGLQAFGRAKSIVCMDGYDLYEVLNGQLSLGEIIDAKARLAGETGNPFIRVRDLRL
ncbi:restriction endonuclease [Hyphomonas oceanitis]|uniref:restriction endonuclease n=1 Tax=Hyphomonas oceanitis TaxID=81033 RepID=UPI0030028E1E